MAATTRARWIWLFGFVLAIAAPPRQAASVDVLVSNLATGQVTQLDGATGALEGIFVLAGTEELSSAAGLRLGPDGLLYVGTSGSVYRFDASTGVFDSELETGLPGAGFFLAFGPDGTLFGNAFAANRVFRFDGTTEALSYIGGPPLVPTGVDIGPDGNLYVGSFAANRVERFNPTSGASLGVFATVPIAGPEGAAGATRFGPDGRLYVALYNGADIFRFDGTTGASLGSFIPEGHQRPAGPSALAWGPDGNLYVSSSASGEVLRYDGTTGAFLGVFAAGLDNLWGLEFVPDVEPPPHPLPCLLPLVDTTSGSVQGCLDGGVRSYKGIPYAESPSGSLRWKRPERKAESPTPILAASHGPVCPQPIGPSAFGAEDCLKVSIWRPDTSATLPVLFFIHGGYFTSGSFTDGAALALAQNLIVVEPQYRLGALGFFGLPELAAEDPNGSTGNYGFLDQLEALRWVRDNVAAFGGDPNQVTIAGHSAGAYSVCALMASPLSDGLFRAGIMQSGLCEHTRPLDLPDGSPQLADPVFGTTIYRRGRAVATEAGCAVSDLACLRGKSAAELVQALETQPPSFTGFVTGVPALDGYVLSEQPVVLLRQGAADQRPMMIGSNANESTHWSQNLEPLLPNAAAYEFAVRQTIGNTRANAILPLYPVASYPSPAEAFRTLIDEAGVVCRPLDAADAIAAGGSPAWVYHVTFPPTYGPGASYPGRRTYHGFDTDYMFGRLAQVSAAYGIVTDADDVQLVNAIQEAVGSFVRTGTPATAPAWPVYAPATPGDLASVSVFQFNVPSTVVPGPAFRSGRCAALVPVGNFLDADRDVATYDQDNCPSIANTSQSDTEADAVGDVCDNCVLVNNPRQAAGYLDTNPWRTLTGGQIDDDHDGYGNKCDAKFVGLPSAAVGGLDLAQLRASNNENRTADTCGTSNTRPCAIFDLDEAAAGNAIGGFDLGRFRQLNLATPGPRCVACTGTGSVPLPCTAGTAGACAP